MLILVLDDDSGFIKSLAFLMKAELYKRHEQNRISIVSFSSAIDLYNWIITQDVTINQPGMLIADINTPESVDPALRNMQSTPILAWMTEYMKSGAIQPFPIFAVSGDTSPETAAHAIAAGCEELLRKPLTDISFLVDIILNGYTRQLRWQYQSDNLFIKPLLLRIMSFTLRTFFNAKQKAANIILSPSDIRLILSDIYPYLYCKEEEKEYRRQLVAVLGGHECIVARLRIDIGSDSRLDQELRDILAMVLNGLQIGASRRKKEGKIDALTERLSVIWNE